MNPYEVLRRPLLSEKSNDLREQGGQYTFQVSLKSNKKDVKLAIERMYDVKVTSVNTTVVRGKIRRRGYHVGQPKNWKKAVVTLAEGNKLPLFEDQ